MTKKLLGALAAVALISLVSSAASGQAEPGPDPDTLIAVVTGQTAPVGASLRGAEEGGRYVVLGDGTRWEVHAPRRPTTDGWVGGDYIIVRRNPAFVRAQTVQYDYVLSNGATGSIVEARFVGLAAARAASASDEPDA